MQQIQPANSKCKPFHPVAEIFPLMTGQDFDQLVESIKLNGLRESIVIFEGKILDGRNRALACEAAGVEPRFIPLPEGADPATFVINKNLHRRHLDAQQKRELIGKLLEANPEKSNLQIAGIAKADDKTVAKVRDEKERRSEIPNVETRADSKGRKQPAKKRKPRTQRKAELPEVETDVPIAPTATPTKSWKVEVVAKDGKRYGNGVRLKTEEEADAYRLTAPLNRRESLIVVATEVIPCDDAPSGACMLRNKKGHFTYDLGFVHGTCHTLGWEEIATPAFSEKATTVSSADSEIMAAEIERLASRLVGNDPESAHELYKLLHDDESGSVHRLTCALGRGLGIGEDDSDGEAAPSAPAAPDDGLDIPDCLRRVPKEAGVS